MKHHRCITCNEVMDNKRFTIECPKCFETFQTDEKLRWKLYSRSGLIEWMISIIKLNIQGLTEVNATDFKDIVELEQCFIDHGFQVQEIESKHNKEAV